MTSPTVLVVDNYDSFAYNLVQYVGEALAVLGHDPRDAVVVRRNDAIDVADVRELDPDGIVVSPGPGTPAEAGVSVALFSELAYPTLGVCLGHQALCVAHGAPVGHAPAVVHGKPSTVVHDGRGVFRDLPDRLEVGRYHSLSVERGDLPDPLVETARIDDVRGRDASAGHPEASASPDARDLEATADTSDLEASVDERGVVMGVRHREKPHAGVQFHPESILTDAGERMVRTFCERALGV